MTFSDLALCAPVQEAVQAAGYTEPTPIQQQAIPVVLTGSDVFACAQTGTGKTAAFALPILTKLHESPSKRPEPSVVVLAPTRELTAQIGDSFLTYGKRVRARYLTVFGGVNINPQIHALRRGVDVLIATPGRLIDLIEQRAVRLDHVHTLVLDEADRMLDMGFLPQINRVIERIPKDRQTLFFSATIPNEIRTLADSILQSPIHVAVAPVSSTAERVEQRRYLVSKTDKRKLLRHLLENDITEQVLVFSRTKRGADRVAEDLEKYEIKAVALHGDKTQAARERALRSFKDGRVRVLIATDIASRGIDISQLPVVVNYDLPDSPETYVHRIGRTARAGREGEAITFYTPEEHRDMRDIEHLIQQRIPVVQEHPFLPGSPQRSDDAPHSSRPSSAPRAAKAPASRGAKPAGQYPQSSSRRSRPQRQRH